MTQIVKYRTDVLKAYDGTEARIKLRTNPRQSYQFSTLLADEATIREWRAALVRDLADSLELPIWHDAITTSADISASATTIPGDFSYSELASGDTVLIQSADALIYETRIVNTVAAGQITITVGTTSAYAQGSVIVPVIDAQMPDGAGFERYPTNAARFSLSLDLKVQPVIGGNGAAAIATHNSLNVLDRRHANDEPVNETFLLGMDLLDSINAFQVEKFQTYGDIVTVRKYHVNSIAERQWWRAFLAAAHGMREPFYVSTWRPDLVIDTQPSIGGTTFLVTDAPNYVREYWYSAAHKSIHLETLGGTLYRLVTNAVDNMDGTITLTISPALPGDADSSTIESISFLELSRFGSDEVTFEHFSSRVVVTATIRTTQQ